MSFQSNTAILPKKNKEILINGLPLSCEPNMNQKFSRVQMHEPPEIKGVAY